MTLRTSMALTGRQLGAGRPVAWIAVSVIALMAVAFFVTPSIATAQPRQFELVRYADVPPGTYSAFVIATYGGKKEASYAAIIHIGDEEFPVVVRGGETMVIPFEPAWPVTQPVTIELSPYAPTDVIRVWGIDPTGPVAFRYRKQ